MRIQELEQQTGLDRATIRFYEKQELIRPQRADNGYREYSETESEQLMKIKLLRQLGMSLEQIKMLQQGSGEFGDLLDRQILVLKAQVDAKKQAISVCEVLRSDGATYADMDVRRYLALLQERPASPEPKQPLFAEPVEREIHPVRRYVARMMDINIFTLLVYAILFLGLRLRPIPTGILGNLIGSALWLVWLPLEALFLSRLGTTPGKWIMGIRLERAEGGKLSFSQALSRAWRVFGRGLGYTIPLWALWRLYRSYREHAENVDMDWDDGTEITYGTWEGRGKTLLAGVAALVLSVSIWLAVDSYLPRYRTDALTVKQFAENYNYYQSVIFGNSSAYDPMFENGRFPEEAADQIIIYMDGEPENRNQNFEFETDGDRIRRITYHNRWTNVAGWTLLPMKCDIAAITAVLSQPEMRYEQVREFLSLWEEASMSPEGRVEFCGVSIRWNTETENLEQITNMYFPENPDAPTSLTFEFEILIDSN